MVELHSSARPTNCTPWQQGASQESSAWAMPHIVTGMHMSLPVARGLLGLENETGLIDPMAEVICTTTHVMDRRKIDKTVEELQHNAQVLYSRLC